MGRPMRTYRFLLVATLLVTGFRHAASVDADDPIDEEDDLLMDNPSPRTVGAPPTVDAAGAPADDVSLKGNCSRDAATFCKDIVPGGGRLLECLSARVTEEKLANVDSGLQVSAPCQGDLRDFKIQMYSNLKLDKKLYDACKADIGKHCENDPIYGDDLLRCLKDKKDSVTPDCKEEVFKARLDAAVDYAFNPGLKNACSKDVKTFCNDTKPGGGRVQACLTSHLLELGQVCADEMFIEEIDNTDDIRLNVRLYKACINDKKAFCNDIVPGEARVKDCLEAHRLESSFSASCKGELEKMMARRALDFRLDAKLVKYCGSDITNICDEDMDYYAVRSRHDSEIIQCIQDFKDELTDPMCRQQVHRLTQRAAEDIRFNYPLAAVCKDDLAKFCEGKPDKPFGPGEEVKCLQDHKDQLALTCQSVLFEQEMRMAEDIDFKLPMKQACAMEIKDICKDIEQGHGRVIKCLQASMNLKSMSEECKKEVKSDMEHSAQDYRLNYKLTKACVKETSSLCLHACDEVEAAGSDTCNGKMIECLEKNVGNLSSSCGEEVFLFQKLEAADIQLDVPLQMACKDDLTKFCERVSKDHSKTLTCLRKNREQLTDKCKVEEMRFSEMEASDIRLTPTLMNACGLDLNLMCRGVRPSNGEAFKCLQEALLDDKLGAACQGEVNIQEARHAANYKLDIRLRDECTSDVQRVCKDADKGQEGHAKVLLCLISNFKNLTAGCGTEVSYAVRMALFQYLAGADLTKQCDGDVDKYCPSHPASTGNVVVGYYGQCLSTLNATVLNPECYKLVRLANRKGLFVGGKQDSAELQKEIDKLKNLLEREKARAAAAATSITIGLLVIPGWTAITVVALLSAAMFAVAYQLFRRYTGPHRNYTVVIKEGDV
eukprot:SM000001S04499  [mRNA]  locus=s1:550290:556763:- [translate_table: standard]